MHASTPENGLVTGAILKTIQARWARDSHGAHRLWAAFVDSPEPEQGRPLHWPQPVRVDQTRACWGSLEIQEFQCE